MDWLYVGEYPASSTSASEAANEKMMKVRGPGKGIDHYIILLSTLIYNQSL